MDLLLMNKVNASFYMLGSFIFLVSIIIPQFANAQEEISKINEQQKEALKLFFNSPSQPQQQQISTDQTDKESDIILNSQIQEKGMQQQQQQQQQQQTNIDDHKIEPFMLFFNAREQYQEQKVKQQQLEQEK